MRIILWTFAFLIIFINNTQASLSSLVETDFITGSGDRKITWDTRTGLQWLDLTETKNQSVFAILSGYGGWINNGFRYATGAEFNTLLDTAGFDRNLTDIEFYQDQIPGSIKLSALVDKLGKTVNDTYPQFTAYGFIKDQRYDLGSEQVMYVGLSGVAGQQYGYQYFTGTTSSTSPITQDPNIGSFLVRNLTPIPIPPAFLLFSSFLAFSAVFRKFIK